MRKITVPLAQQSYPIYVGQQLLQQPNTWQHHIVGKQVMIISNPTIAARYRDALTHSLHDYDYDYCELPDGEQYKTLTHASHIFDALIQKQHHRDTTVLALGGGVIGDMAGFAAACYQRGVALIQLPTTLLAQVDSAIGGKTGVNHPQGKNMIGAFYQPCCVVIDIDTITTLPDRHYYAGIAEIIKYALLADSEFLIWLETNMPALVQRETRSLEHAIQQSCRHKAAIVAADEKESNQRMLLNLGHTFGHALETITHYQTYLHGEAVAIGLCLAAEYSAQQGYIATQDVKRIKHLVQQAKLPIDYPQEITAHALLAAMQQDKKICNRQLRLILLKQLGRAFVANNVPSQSIISFLEERHAHIS